MSVERKTILVVVAINHRKFFLKHCVWKLFKKVSFCNIASEASDDFLYFRFSKNFHKLEILKEIEIFKENENFKENEIFKKLKFSKN